MKKIFFVLLLFFISVSTGCGGGTTADDTADEISADYETAGDVGKEQGDSKPDMEVVVPSDEGEGFDVIYDVFETEDAEYQEFEAETGFVECEKGSDCPTGFCVERPDGVKVCAPECIDECPEGWLCKQVINIQNDVIFICLPEEERICKPCLKHSDCYLSGVKTNDLCVDFDGNGMFCGIDCSENGLCPDGYECKDVQIRDAGSYKQCLPVDGECECTQDYILNGYSTICVKENIYGKCSGERKCAAEGLTGCSAPEPEPEKCDGLDNDCNNLTDDALVYEDCKKENGFGACFGKQECLDKEVKCLAPEPAKEKCGDNADNDCDGFTDEAEADGCVIYYYDGDKDDFGRGDLFKCLCKSEDNYTSLVKGDCDDNNPEVNPLESEKCNGYDDNCNNETDEENADDCYEFFMDFDGDGFGAIGDSRCLCAPDGYYKVLKGGDCNDMDPAINPDADEICNGKDDDCNFIKDDENALNCGIYFRNADSDPYGKDGDTRCLCGPEGIYTATKGGDCDDGDAGVNPDIIESCNAKDDNCNGLTDEENAIGCLWIYYDNDGDGYGLCDDKKCLCGAGPFYKAYNCPDCDDQNSEVFPTAQEKCNSLDDNCNDLTDEENAEGCTVYHKDEDGDGFGNPADKKCLCQPLGKYNATNGLDCDDSKNDVNPDVKEKCGNNLDDDCNNLTDEENGEGCTVYYFNNDGDVYGVDNDGKCLCQPVGKYNAILDGDCNDDDAGVNPAATEKCNGKDDDCDVAVDEVNAEGCQNFFKDADGDNYGVTNDYLCLCSASDPYDAVVGGDCEDSDANVNPSVLENCSTAYDDNCNSSTNEKDSLNCSTFFYDKDNDGFGTDASQCWCKATGLFRASKSGDCDDDNELVKPGVVENCSTAYDDNCNNNTNEKNGTDCSLYYYDGDLDGFGANQSECWCAPSGLYSAQQGNDCNDGDPSVKPGIKENCATTYDDNCNTLTNERDSTGCSAYYYDFDNDGFGTSQSECWCSPNGFFRAGQPGDCNDGNSAVKPGTTENCSTAYDDNCNNDTNEMNGFNCLDFYYDSDNDGYGTALKQCWCAAKDLYRASQSGDCNDNDSAVKPGIIENCATAYDDNCNSLTNEKGAAACTNFYYDFDNDTYGTTANECWCDANGFYRAVQSGDCNDNDANVKPGVVENCGTAYDDNCNSNTNEQNALNCGSYYYDYDGDGYYPDGAASQCWCAPKDYYRSTQGGDCNDANSNVKPGVAENCTTGYDDNCNGSTNEQNGTACTQYYYDVDGDGYYAAGALSQCWCAPKDLYRATQAGDCDDGNSAVKPGIKENCATVYDDNCNSQTNEKNADNCSAFYYDYDNDSFGTSATECWCAASGYYRATQSGDCNDNNSAVKPGITENCSTGYDDNCNNETNEKDAYNCTQFFYDNDNDTYYPSGASSQCWCAASGFYRGTQPNDCNDSNSSVNPGVTENCSTGYDDNCNSQTNEKNAANCQLFYYDYDGDTYYPSGATYECWCAQSGYYRGTTSGDCNDNDSAINPGVNEKCTTAYDDNCNTSTNEQNATGCTNFYYDFDGDGYYATGAGYQCWCAASGYYRGTSSGDCNDSCSTCYPGASEVCDYLNNDCDSYTDEGFYDADANFLYDSGFNSSYDPVCTYYSVSWYDYDNAWYGPTLACRSTGGSLSISDTARILPSGDVDWLSVASGEYYVDIPPFSWGTSVKCEAQLTGITGESYEVCVCWSRNTQCDITSFDCKTSTGSSVAARTDMSDNLAVDDYGWCDIRIKGVGSGDYHCSQYNLTVTVWE